MRRSGIVCFALAAAGISLAAHACRAPTQVTLEIRSNQLACQSLKGVQIVVAEDASTAEDRVRHEYITTTAGNCPANGHEVGTLVVTPGSSGKAAVIVIAGVNAAADKCRPDQGYKGCIVARRRLSFIDNAQLRVPIDLDVSCVDVPCDAVSTCKSGQCLDSELSCGESGTCSPVDPRLDPSVDSGPPPERDGAAQDGAGQDGPLGDAPADAPSDGVADVEVPPTCAIRCGGMDGGESLCAAKEVCCENRVQFPGVNFCSNVNVCVIGGGSSPPGIAACCRNTNDCGANEVCCATLDPTALQQDRGVGIATCRASCNGPNEHPLCWRAACGAGQLCANFKNSVLQYCKKASVVADL